ncbi:uncharacterized protein [Leptinotarsa decemlineata]|uniref:uncharacterized protein n=1 Tax=Leptinotarsa decemlineata TaxID=7539 RepID=UPI003D30B795
MPKQDRGQHSRESDSLEDDRPLKKARFVWEVKGKYHLKDSRKNNNPDLSNTFASNNQTKNDNMIANERSEKEIQCSTNQNQECSSRCCLETLLTKTESIMSNVNEEFSSIVDGVFLDEDPITFVSLKRKTEEYFLQKWQARQLARGFVDNTINSVLDTYSNPPFDATDFVENCQNDVQVEDDAILMAIQSHGLQSSSQRNIPCFKSSENNISFKKAEIEESTQDNFENVQSELIKENVSTSNSNDTDMMYCGSSCSSQMDQRNTVSEDPMEFLNAAVSAAIQKNGLSYSY